MNRLVMRGLFALVLLVGAAGARPASAMQLSPQQKQEMKLHYERATRAYDVGKYQEAIEEYQKAYEIGGDPPMLYNIAQAYRLSDQPADAIRFYRRYLLRAPSARNREDVERKIADLEKVVEERKKAAAAMPPPAPTTAPPPVAVAPVVPPPAPPVTAPSASETEPHARGRGRKIAGWSLVGTGVVIGGAAVAAGIVAKQKADQVSSMSRASPPVPFDPSLESSGKTANTLAIVFGTVAGAVAVLGAVLLLTGGSSSAEAHPPAAQASVTPWLGPGLVGGGLDLRF